MNRKVPSITGRVAAWAGSGSAYHPGSLCLCLYLTPPSFSSLLVTTVYPGSLLRIPAWPWCFYYRPCHIPQRGRSGRVARGARQHPPRPCGLPITTPQHRFSGSRTPGVYFPLLLCLPSLALLLPHTLPTWLSLGGRSVDPRVPKEESRDGRGSPREAGRPPVRCPGLLPI